MIRVARLRASSFQLFQNNDVRYEINKLRAQRYAKKMTTIKLDRKSALPTRIGVTLLAGVADDESVLAKLRGTPHIVRLIFILATNERRWGRCIRSPSPYPATSGALYFTNLGTNLGTHLKLGLEGTREDQLV